MTDAHPVALAGVQMAGLREVVNDQALEVLRLLAGRRRRIGEDHTRMVCQLHRILLELLPGGAKRNLSAAQARRLLAAARPADPAGKTRKRVAMELVADLERVYARKKAANTQLVELVRQTGTGLLALHGIGPSGAARLLVEPGDITRFPAKGHFASWTGTAPYRRVLRRQRPPPALPRRQPADQHDAAHDGRRAAAQPAEGNRYYDRKAAAGKTPNQAMRCSKRRLPDIVYRTALDDLVTAGAAPSRTGPGGHRGNVSKSSAAGSHPEQ